MKPILYPMGRCKLPTQIVRFGPDGSGLGQNFGRGLAGLWAFFGATGADAGVLLAPSRRFLPVRDVSRPRVQL
jgi:hypothetical protein